MNTAEPNRTEKKNLLNYYVVTAWTSAACHYCRTEPMYGTLEDRRDVCACSHYSWMESTHSVRLAPVNAYFSWRTCVCQWTSECELPNFVLFFLFFGRDWRVIRMKDTFEIGVDRTAVRKTIQRDDEKKGAWTLNGSLYLGAYAYAGQTNKRKIFHVCVRSKVCDTFNGHFTIIIIPLCACTLYSASSSSSYRFVLSFHILKTPHTLGFNSIKSQFRDNEISHTHILWESGSCGTIRLCDCIYIVDRYDVDNDQ